MAEFLNQDEIDNLLNFFEETDNTKDKIEENKEISTGFSLKKISENFNKPIKRNKMAEFLSQDEIDALLDIAEDEFSKEEYEDIDSLKNHFSNKFIKSIKSNISYILNTENINIESIDNNVKSTKYLCNEFNLYEIDNSNHYNYKFFIPSNKITLIKNKFILNEEMSELLETHNSEEKENNEINNIEENNDAMYEFSEHILGSFLTSINSNLNNNKSIPYLRENRIKQNTFTTKNMRLELENKDYYIFSIKCTFETDKKEEIEFIIAIQNNLFKVKKINNSGFCCYYSKNYCFVDFRKNDGALNEIEYKCFALFQKKLSKIVEEELNLSFGNEKDINVVSYSLEQMLSSEFILSIPQITSISVLESNVLNCNLITEINPSLNNKIIYSLLGFKKNVFDYDLEISNIEKEIYKKYHNDIIIKSINKSFKGITKDVNFTSKRSLFDANDLYINENQMVTLIVLEITIEEESGFLSIAFPTEKIKPLLNKLVEYFAEDSKYNKNLDLNLNLEYENLYYKEIFLKNEEVKEGNKLSIYDLKLLKNKKFNKLFISNKKVTNKVEVSLGQRSIENLDDIYKKELIELEQMENEPLELYINKEKIGEGQAITINKNYGVKITKIENNIDEIINKIEKKYFIIEKNKRLFLCDDNMIIFEINKDKVLIKVNDINNIENKD